MTRITVLGGTGYAGGHIVREAAERGHKVTSISRNAPADPIPGVTYEHGSVLDSAVLAGVVDGADVVIEALAPRGELAGRLRQVDLDLADLTARANVRLGVIGGAGSLRVNEDGPRVADTPDFPPEFAAEADEMAQILDDLRTRGAKPDWFYVSPAGVFGADAPGEKTGSYRLGDEILLTDEAGNSFISGPDFAAAILDEIETPAHHRARFTVAY